MRKNNKIFRKLFCFIIIIMIILNFLTINVLADVGDYGSDWSDSDWDYDYDYDYGSSWDDDYSYSSWDDDDDYYYSSSYYSGGGYSSSSGFAGMISFIVILIVFCAIISASTKNSRNKYFRTTYFNNRNYGYRNNYPNINGNNRYNTIRRDYRKTVTKTYENPLAAITTEKAQTVENQILAIDVLFSREEFESWVKQIFIKLQYAWTERNWAEIRTFETNELFEQHNMQLNKYIERKQINMLEQVSVSWVKLYNFYQTAERDVLEVAVNSRMIDYIVDEETKEVISGDKYSAKIRTYKLTFIRKKGIKTEPGKITAKAINCPNCGGQLTMTQAGKCEYCGSIVVVDDHGWALSELEPFNK